MAKLSRAEAAFVRAVELLCEAPLSGESEGTASRKLVMDATRCVQRCIEDYYGAKQSFANAPRLKGLSEQYQTFEHLASEMAAFFKDRRSLFVHGLRLQAQAHGRLDEIEAFIDWCSSPLMSPRGLRLAVGLARDERQLLAYVYGTGEPTKPDDGGRANLYKEVYDTPRRQLFRGCAVAYGKFHSPEAITAGSKGHFQKFLAAAWEAAGENESELTEVVLRRELRDLVPVVRDVLTRPIEGLAKAREVCARAFAQGLAEPQVTNSEK